MANMIDYLVWRGDIPFSCSPFNDVDNLILASFAYLMPEKANLSFDSVSIAELALALGDNTEAFGFIDVQSNRRMLQLMGESERFGGVTVNDYRYETDESCEKQFAAMTFYLPTGRLMSPSAAQITAWWVGKKTLIWPTPVRCRRSLMPFTIYRRFV